MALETLEKDLLDSVNGDVEQAVQILASVADPLSEAGALGQDGLLTLDAVKVTQALAPLLGHGAIVGTFFHELAADPFAVTRTHAEVYPWALARVELPYSAASPDADTADQLRMELLQVTQESLCIPPNSPIDVVSKQVADSYHNTGETPLWLVPGVDAPTLPADQRKARERLEGVWSLGGQDTMLSADALAKLKKLGESLKTCFDARSYRNFKNYWWGLEVDLARSCAEGVANDLYAAIKSAGAPVVAAALTAAAKSTGILAAVGQAAVAAVGAVPAGLLLASLAVGALVVGTILCSSIKRGLGSKGVHIKHVGWIVPVYICTPHN